MPPIMELQSSEQMKQKEELNILLNQYKNILNNEIIEYLMDLLELKISVIKEMHQNSEKIEALKELPIFQQIAIYNICWDAIEIIKKSSVNLMMYQTPLKISLLAKMEEENVPLFLYHTGGKDKESKNSFGSIDLYRVMYDEDVRIKMRDEIMVHLQTLRKELTFNDSIEIEDYRLLQYYQDRLNQLEENRELSKEELRKIDITMCIQQLLIENYGLTQCSFVDESIELLKKAKNADEEFFLRCKLALANATSPYQMKSYEKELILVKRLPQIEIRNITKYII